ncbi:hypothetical protein ANN_09012 [Periplaneta americana]|uniref:Ion transport domain-containing protein n=1 Tax=Periplaneta americana TaxID=6978 RepID=A0ABQ8TK77_PERAM|nr:hypothetical protein ANN_09012 [Periplaneta americana]
MLLRISKQFTFLPLPALPYVSELWQGNLNWAAWRTMLLFFGFIFCPPIWVTFTLPLGHKYYKVPIIKFMSYLTSHIYLMVFLLLTGVTPVYPTVRPKLLPYWYEWVLLVWLSGLLLFELTNPSDKTGLGWIKLCVLLFGVFGVGVHSFAMTGLLEKKYWPTVMYMRNQLFSMSFLFACVQILDFLSFHHLFGPWAIIIGNLMKDLARFLAVLAIFVFGFSMNMVSLNQPFTAPSKTVLKKEKSKFSDTFGEVLFTPIEAFEQLFFAVFGMSGIDKVQKGTPGQQVRPGWTEYLFKIMFMVYMLVSVVVLINLLIAMMSDTYQRIQAQSDIEWKYGLAKLIRNMHRTTTTPSPLNLLTSWIMYLLRLCRQKDSVALSVVHLSPLGSQLSFSNSMNRIENVTDWDSIAKKYKALMGEVTETSQQSADEEDGNPLAESNNNVTGSR